MTKAEFTAKFKDFEGIDDAAYDNALELFDSLHSAGAFVSESLYNKTRELFVAHELTQSSPEKAGAANVTAEKIGDMSLSYKVNDDYDSTSYGRSYKRTLRVGVGPAILVGKTL